jgi:uncharacterized membrane protein
MAASRGAAGVVPRPDRLAISAERILRLLGGARLGLALLLLTGWGLVFSSWLTYLELFVIDAICQWCVVSAVLAAVLFVISFLDYRELQAPSSEFTGGREDLSSEDKEKARG